MKRILFFLAASASLYCKPLDLSDCLAEGLAHSKKLQGAQAQILLSEAIANQALAPLLPHFDIDGRYELKNHGRDYSVFTEFGSAFSAKTIGVTARWMLFDFFSSWNKYQAGKCDIRISEKNYQKLSLRLEEEIKIAYFKLLQNERSAKVMEDSAARLEKQLASQRELFKRATASSSDLLALQMQLIEQKKNLLHAHGETIQSKIFLNSLLGRNIFSPLELADLPIDSYPERSLELMQQQALSNQCDIAVLNEKLRSLDHLLKSAREAFAPSLFAFGGYQYLDDAPPASDSCHDSSHNWISGGIGVTFSLYDGGRKRSELRKIEAQIASVRADLEDLKYSVLKEVNQRYLKCKGTLETIGLDGDAIRLAEENVRAVSERYSQGLDSLDLLLKAEQACIRAQTAKNDAIYSYHIDRAHLETALNGLL